MNNKILATMLIIIITICSSVSVLGMPIVSESVNSVFNEVNIIDSREKSGDIEKRIQDIENKIYNLNIQIEPLQLVLERNKKEIENITMITNNTKKEIEQYKKEINELDLSLGKRVKALYVSGNLELEYLSFVFESESTSDFFTRVQAVSKIVEKDKLALKNTNQKKEELVIKINSLEDKKNEINKLNRDAEDILSKLEVTKKEQEIFMNQVKTARSNYDLEYVSELERNAVSVQFNVIDNSNSSLEEILGAIYQLTSIRNNQIKSPIVREEVNEEIKKAKVVAKRMGVESDNMIESNEMVSSKISYTSKKSLKVINEAYKYIGKDYVWGATGPDNFDCSGFTQYVYKQAIDIDVSRTTYTQMEAGFKVSQEELKPGDLVFPREGHVGIYVGNGQMIHAPHVGDVIKVGPVFGFYESRRIIKNGSVAK